MSASPLSASPLADGPPPGISASRTRLRATLIGFSAILMWSTLPLLTTSTGRTPPFLLVALAFALAFALAWAVATAGRLRSRRAAGSAVRPRSSWRDWPLAAWLVGVGGLFGYHFFYFIALRTAPPAEASLINHLWPLLIVLFSALLPGERLRPWHIAGAALGLAGTILLVTRGGAIRFPVEYAKGYAAALTCALIWSSYSVASRRFARVPTEAVGHFCGVTAILAVASHLVFETTVWPVGGEWLAVLAMGLGPVGIAFFAWDVGMKHGDIRVLGACGYLTPLLSTALLVAFGRAEPTWTLALASLLIAGGAALAARDLLFARRPRVASVPSR